MKVLITGITGQDGSYLSDLLIARGDSVVGVKRRSSTDNCGRVAHLLGHPQFTLVEGDVVDPHSCLNLINTHRPDWVINLAAQSHVHTSFEQPSYTFQVNAVGVLNLLEAIRISDLPIKFFQASTSEMFGSEYTTKEVDGEILRFQNEDTVMNPNSPYAAAKLAAFHLVKQYRQAYGVWAASNIMFNHESPRRGENFVTRKVTKYVAEFANSPKSQLIPSLELGNLDAMRDWGHSLDTCRAIISTLSTSHPNDYVVATGKAYSVRDLCRAAFAHVGISDWENYVEVNAMYYRPCEVPYLLGDSSKIRDALGWEPSYTFEDLVREMVDSDIKNYKGTTHELRSTQTKEAQETPN